MDQQSINAIFDAYIPALADSNVPTMETDLQGSTASSSTESPMGSSGFKWKKKSIEENKAHARIERDRRDRGAKLLLELKQLMDHSRPRYSRRLCQEDLLVAANRRIDQINLKSRSSPMDSANLTEDEKHFLQIEASNSFLLIIDLRPPSFPIIYVNESINRVLGLTAEQWLHRDLTTLLHPDDLGRIQTQLIALNSPFSSSIHIKCRIQNASGSYSSIVIDGITKKFAQYFQLILDERPGYPALVAVCYLPLANKYKDMNQYFYSQQPSLLTFHCRCYPDRWLIFLVDQAISTIAQGSYQVFYGKSILEFIRPDERLEVDQALSQSNIFMLEDVISCHFIEPNGERPIPMKLVMKPFINTNIQRTDFIHLQFEQISD